MAHELNVMKSDFVAHITPSWRGEGYGDVHVTHRLADKEHAVKQWLSMMNITAAETVGMGDSGNDLPIFNAVGLKIAVGNATPELKLKSDFISPSQADGALEHVLLRFFR